MTVESWHNSNHLAKNSLTDHKELSGMGSLGFRVYCTFLILEIGDLMLQVNLFSVKNWDCSYVEPKSGILLA